MEQKSLSSVVNVKIRLVYSCLAALGVLFVLPFDFPLYHWHNRPTYHEDDHDVCRAAGWIFGSVLLWYVMILYLLVKSRFPLSYEWGRQLLIYPTLVVSLIGVVALVLLLYTFYIAHSERAFSNILNSLNGIILLTNLYLVHTIVKNALSESHRYAWDILFRSTLVFLLTMIVLAAREKQWYVASYTGLLLPVFVWGFLESKPLMKKQLLHM